MWILGNWCGKLSFSYGRRVDHQSVYRSSLARTLAARHTARLSRDLKTIVNLVRSRVLDPLPSRAAVKPFCRFGALAGETPIDKGRVLDGRKLRVQLTGRLQGTSHRPSRVVLLSPQGVDGFRTVGYALCPSKRPSSPAGCCGARYRRATRLGLNGPKSTLHEYLSFPLLLCLKNVHHNVYSAPVANPLPGPIRRRHLLRSPCQRSRGF